MSRRVDRSSRRPRLDHPRARPPMAGRFGRIPGRPVGWTARVRRLRRPASWRVPIPMGAGSWVKERRLPDSLAGRVLCGVLATVTLMAGIWGVSRSALLDVDHVEVIGAFQVAAADAVAASGIDRGDPLLGVDESGARRRLEALPWVRHATVERAMPNRVRIRLRERLATASAARPDGGYVLLDETGRVLAERPQRPEGLPELQGSGEPPAPGAWLRPARPGLLVVGALPEALRGHVSVVSVDGGSVNAQVGGREVRFGAAEELEAKAAALGAVLDHLGDRRVSYVDVRVPSAPVVAPTGGPASPGSTAAASAAPRD